MRSGSNVGNKDRQIRDADVQFTYIRALGARTGAFDRQDFDGSGRANGRCHRIVDELDLCSTRLARDASTA